ncbi:MAG: ribosome biogenesis GTP-binding protein YihA/YsxC [Candidatus Gracilibacteria bacterium]|nr:ribosome biogenesis GTP-binding protein YihA/YsxC [Candidatus Gracilibacteria bacterium]
MKIEKVELYKVLNIETKDVFFDERKEIIFLGRSNAGKSSLLNTLFNTKSMARTSSKPGSTKTVNMFLVNNKYYFTDLPGYGFAKLGIVSRDKIDALISWYTEARSMYLKQAIMIVDSKLGPQKQDEDMYLYLKKLNMPILILNNKIDKLSKNDANKSHNHASQVFFGEKIINFSTVTKEGLKELISILDESFKK